MSKRRLEQSTMWPQRDGSTMQSDWEPFTGEGGDVPDTHGWDMADFSRFVRAWNRAAKYRGDYTSVRSVKNEDAFS